MREPLSVSRLADIIDQARGKAPADLVVKSVGIFDLTSGDVTVGDIAIAGDRIVGTHESYHGATEIDALEAHHKRNPVAANTTSVALPQAFVHAHRERRSAVLVERTTHGARRTATAKLETE